MRSTILISAILALQMLACTGKRQLTPEEQQQVVSLKTELKGLEGEIASAEGEDRLYTGGLIKSLLAVRLEVLRTTKALLQQRIHSIETGAPVKVETVVTQADPERARQIESEIRSQTAEVKAAREEAALYSGGLVGALKASTVATQENTLAMLRQHYVLAKYGLVLPAAKAETHATGEEHGTPHTDISAPVQPERVQPEGALKQEELFHIVEVDARVTEANSTWAKYAWKLTVRNLTAQPLSLEATIEFQDADGFVIDDDSEYDLVLAADQEKTFTGYDLIDADVAGKVKSVSAKVKAR